METLEFDGKKDCGRAICSFASPGSRSPSPNLQNTNFFFVPPSTHWLLCKQIHERIKKKQRLGTLNLIKFFFFSFFFFLRHGDLFSSFIAVECPPFIDKVATISSETVPLWQTWWRYGCEKKVSHLFQSWSMWLLRDKRIYPHLPQMLPTVMNGYSNRGHGLTWFLLSMVSPKV